MQQKHPFLKVSVRLLQYIDGENNITMIARKADTGYTNTCNSLKRFSEIGLIVFSTEGRKKIPHLTAKGKSLKKDFDEIIRLVKEGGYDGKSKKK
jgi:predicted transcriptional regulator